MKNTFVENISNVRNFLAGYKALQKRGANESCLMLVDGEPGSGKTSTMTWWATQTGAIMIRAKEDWTPPRFYRDVLSSCAGGKKQNLSRNPFGQVIEALSTHQAAMREIGKTAIVIIYEADHMLRYPKGALLETLRDITDTIEIPSILVGMDRLNHQVNKYPQVARRISQRVPFRKLSQTDVKAMISGLSDVEVKDDLAAALWSAAGGYACEVLEGIAAIERFARRGNTPLIGVAEMAGQPLLYSRVTGKPILVEGPQMLRLLAYLAGDRCLTTDMLIAAMDQPGPDTMEIIKKALIAQAIERDDDGGCFRLTAEGRACQACRPNPDRHPRYAPPADMERHARPREIYRRNPDGGRLATRRG